MYVFDYIVYIIIVQQHIGIAIFLMKTLLTSQVHWSSFSFKIRFPNQKLLKLYFESKHDSRFSNIFVYFILHSQCHRQERERLSF